MNYILRIKKDNKKKFNHIIERRIKRANIRKQKKKLDRTPLLRNEFNVRTFQYQTEKVPDVFCLFSNTNDCILFFNRIMDNVINGKKIFIDMSSVKHLDASAIIFLLSMLKNLKHRRIKFNIRGNFPEDNKNYEYLCNTGFFSYIETNALSIERSDKTVMIKEGHLVLNEVSREVCDFIMLHASILKVDIKPYYELIIELMKNTKHHAYDDLEYVHNWYIYCQVLHKKVTVIFFDNGLGIPTTVNKTKMEELVRWINKKGIMIGGDIDILEAALDGAFKTKTQQENRGKGMPMINTLIQDKHLKNIKIISNHAYYSDKKKYDTSANMQGTFYYWEVN